MELAHLAHLAPRETAHVAHSALTETARSQTNANTAETEAWAQLELTRDNDSSGDGCEGNPHGRFALLLSFVEYASQVSETALICGGAAENTVTRGTVFPLAGECDELVKNGNLESGNYTHWYHCDGGVSGQRSGNCQVGRLEYQLTAKTVFTSRGSRRRSAPPLPSDPRKTGRGGKIISSLLPSPLPSASLNGPASASTAEPVTCAQQ